MIPIKFLAKFGLYEVQIRGVTLKVRVADDPGVIDIGISELKSEFGTTVVGFNILSGWAISGAHHTIKSPALLELCVGTRCLIIPTDRINRVPKRLNDFLADKEICFVGFNMGRAIYDLQVHYYWDCLPWRDVIVELSDLVAKFLKKPNLGACGLEELARKVEVNLIKEESARDDVKVNWFAKVLSEEQIKHAVRDVHAYYLIAKKILE